MVLSRAASLLLLALAGPAAAAERRAAPLGDWQPREALAARLAERGLTITRLRVDDGCYKVMAVDRDGRVVKGRFDPATLEPVARDDDDGHGRHGHHGEHD